MSDTRKELTAALDTSDRFSLAEQLTAINAVRREAETLFSTYETVPHATVATEALRDLCQLLENVGGEIGFQIDHIRECEDDPVSQAAAYDDFLYEIQGDR